MKLVLLLVFILIHSVCCQHPFGDKLFRPRGITKPSYIGDPVGIMFETFHEAIKKREGSEPLFPDFKEQKNYKRYNTDEKENINVQEQKIQKIYTRQEREFEGEIHEPREHPERSKFVKQSISKNITTVKSNTPKDIMHTPYNMYVTGKECSGRGTEVGNVKNICQRKDCNVAVLRCPPSFDIVDPEDYITSDLTKCNVGEIQCYDELIKFKDWENTKIYEVILHFIHFTFYIIISKLFQFY